MSHDFQRVPQYFATPPKLYKKSEAVVRIDRDREERRERERLEKRVKQGKSYINE